MKTVSQVMKYLDEQGWKDEFFKYANTVLTFDDKLIVKAFDWTETPQGYSFWKNIHREYIVWYSSEKKVISWKEFKRTNIKLAEQSIGCMPEFVAYRKLIQLRDQWMRATNSVECKKDFKLIYRDSNPSVIQLYTDELSGLSFPSLEMTNEFLNTFKDLLEIAKPLL